MPSAISAAMPWPFGGIWCTVRPPNAIERVPTHSGR